MPPSPAKAPDPARLKDLARQTVRRLQEASFTAYWAGGCVRDLLRGQDPKDYDIATSAAPDDVLRLFPRAAEAGKAFAVVRVRVEDAEFEVATFRRDHAYRDGRRPQGVTFADPRTDARRRDFTINALFYDPVAGKVHDFVDGRRDLERRVVRAVGAAADRFAEDHLRMLRAVRFAATLAFDLDPETAAAIRAQAADLARISAERVRVELTRMLMEAVRPGAAVVMLEALGLLNVILPEIQALKGLAQPPEFHPEGDVFAHTVLMLDLMQERSVALAMAALLHDVGKLATARVADRIRFDGHAQTGAGLSAAIMRRLRFSREETDTVTRCVRDHMRFMDVRRMRASTLRRMVSAPTFPIELELHRLDCLASHGALDNYAFLTAFHEKLRSEPVLPPPWIDGHDVMRLGAAEGPEVGRWKRAAYDAQLEGRFPDREAALRWLAEAVKAEPA